MNKKKNEITIRSSAAEYLTYIVAVGDNPESIEVRYEDENSCSKRINHNHPFYWMAMILK